MLGIFFSEEPDQRLNVTGTESPFFLFMPSCFGLFVNNIYFLNISFPFVFARRIGFPYPSQTWLRPDTRFHEVDLQPGRERVMHPLLRKPFVMRGTYLFQPMFRYQISGDCRAYYDTRYVKDRSIDWENGIGAVFIEAANHIICYPSRASKDWVPRTRYSGRDVIRDALATQVLSSQIMLHESPPSTELLDSNYKQFVKKFLREGISFNRALIRAIEKNRTFDEKY